MNGNRRDCADVEAPMGWSRTLLVAGMLLGGTSVACGTADDAASRGVGTLAVEFVLDTATDYADYSDGYELAVDVSGPVEMRAAAVPTASREVLLERTVPTGQYRVRAGLQPCETADDPCGPRRDSCETDVDLVVDERLLLTVDYQPGRPCAIEPGAAP